MTRDDTALPGYLSRPLTDLVHKDANGLYPHEEALNALDPGQRDFIKAAYLAWVKDKKPSARGATANNCVRKLICMGYEVPKKYLEAVRTARVMQDVEKTKEPLFSKAATTRKPEQLESTEPPQFDFNAANANPVSELAQRELCRRRLLPFILRFRPNYLAGWVHKDICRRVERFVERVERKESPRLLLMMPPRSGKSEVLSRNAPPWILGRYPDWELIACSHTAGLTEDFSRYIRDMLRDPAYTVVFPEAVLNPQSQSVGKWATTKGGGYLAAGLNGGITGHGAKILFVDDLTKDYEAAQSATQRDAAWTWWNSTAYTRLAPGGGVIALMTNWHADDWAGRIQDTMTLGGEVYEVIKFPAINEYGDEYLLPDDTIIQVAEKEPVPEGARLTRPRGTALHPERYTTEALLRIKNNLVMSGQKAVWDALYQQNPIPDEGDFFSKDMFRYYSTAPKRSEMYVYQAWDFAISTSQESDYTVGTTIGVDHRDNAHVLDVRRFKSGDGILIAEYMVDYAKEYRVDALGVEDGQIWKAIESQFLKACTDKRYFPSYEVLKTLTDKKVRAAPLRGRMQAGKVFFDKDAHWFPVQQKELLHFPNVKNDDCVDSLAWSIRLTLTRTPPQVRTPPPQKSWRDKLKDHIGGGVGVGSHMSA